MTKSVSNSDKPRKQYTPQFRNEALKLAERIDDLPEYNIKTIAASLRHQGLLAKASRKRSPVSYCAHDLPVSENLLKWDFTVDAAIPLWLCRRCGRCPGCCRSFRKDKSGHARINVRGSQRWPYSGASYRQNGRRTVCKAGATPSLPATSSLAAYAVFCVLSSGTVSHILFSPHFRRLSNEKIKSQ